jgi:hypothetical protein
MSDMQLTRAITVTPSRTFCTLDPGAKKLQEVIVFYRQRKWYFLFIFKELVRNEDGARFTSRS